jgi:hypothetical protein
MLTTKKIGRNDRCYCGSGRKYKVCCDSVDEKKKDDEYEKMNNGHDFCCENLKVIKECFANVYTDHKIIDITNLLNESNYKQYQLRNYNTKTIMLAKKNPSSKKVFEERGNKEIMIMYRGAYRAVDMDDFDKSIESICKMIDTRLSGKIDNGSS